MTKKLLLVDYENVQQIDLSLLEDKFLIQVYVGMNQKNIPFELVAEAQKLGSRLEWMKIEGNGTNALDFHIAMQLGRKLEQDKQAECFVLSKDKGFDPLLKYLSKQGLKCKRLNSLIELNTRPMNTDEPNYQRVIEVLTKSDSRNRPRRRNTLIKHIATILQNKLSEQDINNIVDLLFANKKISEASNIISYEF